MGKNKVVSEGLVCMTPDDVQAAYNQKKVAAKSSEEQTLTEEDDEEGSPDSDQSTSENDEGGAVDLEQLKKDVDLAMATLVKVKTVLGQLVILPE